MLLALAMVAMFTVPAGLTGTSAALWVGGWYIVGNLLFACFQVPYLTTPSDLLIGYHERTRVFMWRMLFLTVGLLAAGVAAPALVAAGGRGDYTRMALLLAAGMAVSALIAIRGVRRLTAHSGFRRPDAAAALHPRRPAGLAARPRLPDARALLPVHRHHHPPLPGGGALLHRVRLRPQSA